MNNGFFDFNNADEQASFGLIPDGSIVVANLNIRPGGVGQDGWLKQSKTSESRMLDIEFTVTQGEFARRKWWQYFVVENNDKAVPISRAMLRAILESAYGIDPKNMSQNAVMKRRMNGWNDLNGLEAVYLLKIEKGQDGFKDKNVIQQVITPDKPGYIQIQQQPRQQMHQPSQSFFQPPPQQQPQYNPQNAPAWAR